MHVHHKRLVRTEKDFVLLDVVNDDKYLGFYLAEFMNLKKDTYILSDAAERNLGAVISKFYSPGYAVMRYL